MTASAYSLSAAIPTEALEITEGEPVIGGLHGPTRHYFCDYCKSWLYTRPDGFDAFVNVRIPMLDDPARFPPFMETFTSEKLPWVSLPVVRSFEQFPPVESYGSLAEEYAQYLQQQEA